MIPHTASLICLVSLALSAQTPDVKPTGQTAATTQSPAPVELGQLVFQPFRAGDTITTVDTSIIRQKTQIFSGGKKVQEFVQVDDRSCRKVIDILVADEVGPTKLRVRYGALQFLRKQEPQRLNESEAPPAPDERVDPHPLQDKTFVLFHKRPSYLVTDGEGRPIEPSLAALVLEQESVREGELRRAGDRMAHLVSGRKLAIGVAIDVDLLTARAFIGAREAANAIQMTLAAHELRDVDGIRCAVFDARIEVDDEGGGETIPMAADLSGEVFFEAATGRYHGAEISGRMRTGGSAVSDQQAAEVVGEGPWKISERLRYGRKE